VIAAVASAGRSDVLKTKKERHIDFFMIPGPQTEIYKAYDVYNREKGRTIPATFIIDKSGGFHWKYIGRDDHDRPTAGQIIRALD
jgi:alkyl hydroperoxide reductase subunit AhpC